jgi:DNA-binding XRE family transcriptional regulator
MPEMITIPREEYDGLLSAAEMLADLRAYDTATASLTAGTEELVPSEVLDQLLGGDPPLRVWRMHRGLSGADLARRSGVNRVQILDIEAGRSKGSVATLKKLATALRVDLDDLA